MGVSGDNIDVCCWCEMVDSGIDGVVGAVVCALVKVEPAFSPSFFSDVFAVVEVVELLKSRFGDDEENNFVDIRNDLLFPFELSTSLPVLLLFLSDVLIMDLLLPPPAEAAELLLEDFHSRRLVVDFDGVPKGVRGENGGSLSNDSIDLDECRESSDSSKDSSSF